MKPDIRGIAGQFAIDGELVAEAPFGPGHINDSYLLSYRRGNVATRFLLQRINETVFQKPAQVMENIQRVTSHIRRTLQDRRLKDIDRRVLTLVPTHANEPFHVDDAGSHWRLYPFVERTRVAATVDTPEQAYQAGRAFGEFQGFLADLPPPRLHETIPDFHNTPMRLEALERAVRADARERAAEARAEIAFAFARQSDAGVLLDLQRHGEIPERVVHNDAKISNVLLDEASGEGLCVVDLDTVMPGLALYDFGDMVRSMTSRSAEDELDLSKVHVRLPLFEALARGYLETAGAFLSPCERRQLVFAGKLITLEQGFRFLADYLAGDVYYKTQRPRHNLDRCRVQFKIVQSIENLQVQMDRIVEEL